MTTYIYDARGRVMTSTQTPPGGTARVTQYTYTPFGRIRTVNHPDGIMLTYGYDAAQNLRTITDNLGNQIRYSYDTRGNRNGEEIFNADGTKVRSTAYTYDIRNRVRTITAAIDATRSSVTEIIQDAVGNLVTETDPNNSASSTPASTNHYFDNLNRLWKTVDVLAGNTLYAYDVGDRIKQVTAPNNAVTIYTYDDLGNLLTETSPDRGTTTFTYDSAGNRKTAQDARNITVAYSYDSINRTVTVDYPGTSDDVTLTYDAGTGCTYGVGRLCQVVDASGTLRYGYDAFGNITNQTRVESSVTYITQYSYDAVNRPLTITYPDGRLVTYERDAVGRIERVTATVDGSTTTILSGRVYRADGLMTDQIWGNGLAEVRAHDLSGRLFNQFVGSADTRVYDYDLNGNLTRKQTLPDVADYIYDPLNRLEQDNDATPESFTCDANGNRKTRGGISYTYSSATNRLTKIGTTNVSLDAAGNTTSNGSWSYTPNNAGQLYQSFNGGNLVGTYIYNYLRQRTRKVAASASTVFHYDFSGNLLMETDLAGNVTRAYVWADSVPVAQIERGGIETVTYLHSDHLNTPRLGTSDVGAVVWSFEGNAFGDASPSGSRTVNLRFPGQYYDNETGLHYNWNRYYDPKIGRYITSDPIGLKGGTNTFGYVSGNPGKYADPTGLFLVCVQLRNGTESTKICYDSLTEETVQYPQTENAPISSPEDPYGPDGKLPPRIDPYDLRPRPGPGTQCPQGAPIYTDPGKPPGVIVSPGGQTRGSPPICDHVGTISLGCPLFSNNPAGQANQTDFRQRFNDNIDHGGTQVWVREAE